MVILYNNKEPIKDSGLIEGDAILKIEDIEINNIEDIDNIINLPTFAGKEVSLTIKREDKEFQVKATPVFDVLIH